MPLEFITHNGIKYPDFQSIGGASLWIRPLAQYYCKGVGLDIGYSKEAWMLPNAIGIEPAIDPTYDAMRLPKGEYDFIHSSHVLEHVQRNWYEVIDYWLSKIKIGGIMFLYLPHSSQSYWHPSSNRKHIHSFNGSEIEKYLNELGHKVWVSGCDYNHSFVVVCEKIRTTEKAGWINIDNSLLYDIPDLNGDVLQKGCFTENIIENHKYSLQNHPTKEQVKNYNASFTKVTEENQHIFDNIPVGHYVANNVARKVDSLNVNVTLSGI